ncbi:hypothetical protein ACVRWL_09430 [Streptococcus ratti]|uniref:Histidine kinase n=1 Tax=Streptococcus ratti TaxID=1341 RepID=A0A7X9QG67_STRRT|nr:hypothetical protein [Streptococcus ratti]NMD49856.1 hypothetical protein [Streptococcus ratti]
MAVVISLYISRIVVLLTSLFILKRNTKINYRKKDLAVFFLISLLLYVPLSNFYYLDYFFDLSLLYWLYSRSRQHYEILWVKIFIVLYSRGIYELTARFYSLNVISQIYPSVTKITGSDVIASPVLILVQCLLAVATNELFVRILKVDFAKFQKLSVYHNVLKIFRATSVLLLIYYGAQWLSYILFNFFGVISKNTELTIRQYISLIAMFTLIFFVVRLNQRVNEGLEEELLQKEEEEYNNLIAYTHQIESLYNDLRAFRHDYTNILASLQYSIDQGDLESIRESVTLN